MWEYPVKFPADHCIAYDEACRIVRETVRLAGFHAIAGAGIFNDLIITDSIGHVSIRSFPQLLLGYATILRWLDVVSPLDMWQVLVVGMMRSATTGGYRASAVYDSRL